jgi:hypothetical protein
MNLSDLANLGEFVGGLAVIATLIYLAMQLRQNTRALKSATLANNTSIWASMLVDLGSGDKLQAYLHGSSGSRSLPPDEFLQFFLFCRALFVSFENQHHQYQQGMLDQAIYAGYERSFQAQILSMPGFRRYWEKYSNEFSPSFQARVKEMLLDLPDADYGHMYKDWQSSDD